MVTSFKFLSNEKYENAVLLVGLPGIGLVGKIAVDYLLKHLKSKRIAEIFSDSFPPSVFVQSGIIDSIKNDLFVFKHKKKTFLFLAGPVQPFLDPKTGTSKEHYEFAEKIVSTVKDMGVKEIYTLAGINIGRKRLETEPNIIAAATDKKVLQNVKKAGAKYSKEGSLISGAAGLFLGEAKKQNIKGACIMGETNAGLVYGDHGSAKKVIELLVKLFGFKISMKGIEKESKKIEKSFVQLNKQLESREEEKDTKGKSGLTYVR